MEWPPVNGRANATRHSHPSADTGIAQRSFQGPFHVVVYRRDQRAGTQVPRQPKACGLRFHSSHVHTSCQLLLVQVAKMLTLLLVCSLTSTVAVSMTEAPVGEWKSPISSELIVSQSIRLGSPVVAHDGSLIWSEGRPTEGGRQVLVRRSVGCLEQLVHSILATVLAIG